MATEVQSDAAELQQIAEFKKGYSEVLVQHGAIVRNAQQLLSSPILSGDDRNKLQPYRGLIDKSLAAIQKLIRDLTSDLSSGNIEKEALREYHNVFNGEVSDHRLSYIKFLKTYVHLKKYAMECSQYWHQIRSSVEQVGLSANSEFRDQFLNYTVSPGIAACEAVYTFCDRMSRILQLRRDPLSTAQLDGVAEYSQRVQYQLSYVFTPNLTEHMAELFEGHVRDSDQLGEAEELATRKNRTLAPKERPKLPDHRLDTSGNAEWNRTPHYYFQYDPPQLEKERDRFSDVVYMDTHMGADTQYIKSDFIMNIARKKAFSSTVDIEETYTAFLHAFFNLVTDISTMNMSIEPALRDLFIYHLGPQSFFNLTLKFLQEVGTGTMHRRVGSGKMMRKYIPTEFVKKTVLEHWREKVIPSVNKDDLNDYPLYKKIATRVKAAHQKLSQRAIQKFNELPDSVKNAKGRDQIMREHIADWMGATNIVIFKRFLKKA